MTLPIWVVVLDFLLGAALAFLLCWFVSARMGRKRIAEAAEKAGAITRDAEKQAETLKREKLLEVKDLRLAPIDVGLGLHHDLPSPS